MCLLDISFIFMFSKRGRIYNLIIPSNLLYVDDFTLLDWYSIYSSSTSFTGGYSDVFNNDLVSKLFSYLVASRFVLIPLFITLLRVPSLYSTYVDTYHVLRFLFLYTGILSLLIKNREVASLSY